MGLLARIEAKQNELVNHYSLRLIGYRGQRKLAYAARMKALGANFQRLNGMMKDRQNPTVLDWQKLQEAAIKKAA